MVESSSNDATVRVPFPHPGRRTARSACGRAGGRAGRRTRRGCRAWLQGTCAGGDLTRCQIPVGCRPATSPVPCSPSTTDSGRKPPCGSVTWRTRVRRDTASRSTACGCSRAEQMQALPYATQLLARLGADVVKVEPPTGESGRGSQPGDDRPGRSVRRRHLPAQQPRQAQRRHRPEAGRGAATSFLALAPHFDVVAENFKAGTMDRLGLGYDAVAARASVGDLRVGVGLRQPARLAVHATGRRTRRSSRPCRASTTTSAVRDEPPRANPVGALGDISSALFADDRHARRAAPPRPHRRGPARRHRDVRRDRRHDRHRHQLRVARASDRLNEPRPLILDTFRAVRRLVRDAARARAPVRAHLASVVGHPEWLDDPGSRRAPAGASTSRTCCGPRIEAWASHTTRLEAVRQLLTAAGIAAGAVQTASDVIADPHLDGAQHARRDGAHRRRRAARAHPRQPGEAVEGGRGPRVTRAVAGRAHPRGAAATSSASTPPIDALVPLDADRSLRRSTARCGWRPRQVVRAASG